MPRKVKTYFAWVELPANRWRSQTIRSGKTRKNLSYIGVNR